MRFFLGVAMIVKNYRAFGFHQQPIPPDGLYFPYPLLDADAGFARLEEAGLLTMNVNIHHASSKVLVLG
ncbi:MULTISPECIES: hypothetical protein [Erwinia]|uniref:hypothetical protein n=1 Tax=Erwinia TaxID=551 RepID=UPI0005528076|nr:MULTISPECIES: hypothetical protein [Erwinia]